MDSTKPYRTLEETRAYEKAYERLKMARFAFILIATADFIQFVMLFIGTGPFRELFGPSATANDQAEFRSDS